MADTVERKFYSEIGHYGNNLKPGESFTLIRQIGFNPWGGEIGAIVGKGMPALIKEREDSVAKEKEIYEKLTALGVEWVEQAAQTLLIDKALDYLKVPEIKHTSNTWRVNADGNHEISNRVYRMEYSIFESTPTASGAWAVSWSVEFNIQADMKKRLQSFSYTVAGQTKYRCMDEAAAKRYVQGRIDAFAHLFTELSPPIPENKEYLFLHNGYLLPGYTVAPHKPTMDELLDFVDDHDIGGAAPVEERAEKRATARDNKKPKRGKARVR